MNLSFKSHEIRVEIIGHGADHDVIRKKEILGPGYAHTHTAKQSHGPGPGPGHGGTVTVLLNAGGFHQRKRDRKYVGACK